MIYVAKYVYSISSVGVNQREKRPGKRRAGSDFPCGSWKDFRAPTRVGEGKVRDVNRVAAVGVTPSPRSFSETGVHLVIPAS